MPPRRALHALFAAIIAAALVVLGGVRTARADVAVDLYTVGPGSYLFSRFGHSLLCVRDAASDPAEKKARCFDYGVPDREDALHMGWASIRGEAIFIAVALDERVLLEVFGGQGREIEQQRLSLSPAEAARLADRMESDVRERRAYAYHPAFANCSTQLRDRLDEATSGRLRLGKSGDVQMRVRDAIEGGLSGHLLELTGLAFLLGGEGERKPTPWEAMFLPAGLRDAVAERFAAPPVRVSERQSVLLPTSPIIGRVALLILGVALWGLLRSGVRTSRALVAVALVLGGMALVADLVALVVVWPEFRHNWALALLLPTDLALPFLTPRSLAIYSRVRAGMAGLVLLLEIMGVVAQPILPVALLVFLPMVAIDRAVRKAARQQPKAVVLGEPAGASGP